MPPPPAFGTAPAPTGVLGTPLGIAILVALGIAAICSFLPWFSIEGFGESLTENGIDKDGPVTFGLAAVAAGLFFGYGRTGKKGLAIASLVCSALAAIVYIIDYFDVTGQDAGILEVKVGIGLIGGTITAIAATVLLIVAVVKGGKKTA